MARAPTIARLMSGDRRLGPFRLVSELGEGGFAPVFLAVEEHEGVELRTVALKLFDLEALAEARWDRTRFASVREQIIAEARALCRVEHPNIVRFYQLVEEQGLLGLAMEHVRGRSIADALTEAGTIPVDKALAVGQAIASALAAVHGAGLIHRDVKPENVIEAGGTYKLIDFGIAEIARELPRDSAPRVSIPVPATRGRTVRLEEEVGDTIALSRHNEAVRASKSVAGTMGYIDPQCLGRGRFASPASDLYSLGATLYECLGGRLPASTGSGEHATRLRLPVALGTEAAPPVRSFAAHLPEDLARLVDALVAPDREKRPARAEWVASELDRLRRSAAGKARSLPVSGPFRGLSPFAADDRDIYFGRAADLASALDLLRQRGAIAIVGPSGCGKTSFARASLVPAIAEGALGSWPPRYDAIVVAPGADPDATLSIALRPFIDASAPPDPSRIADELGAHVARTSTGIVFVVDALEELVTLAGTSTAMTQLIEELDARPRPGVRVVLTLRRDMIDALLALAPLVRTLTRGALLLAPLTASALVACMEERLSAYGYAFEDEATQRRLASDLGVAAESMPLVEFALARLWTARDDEKRIVPNGALEAIGGFAGALEHHAEATLGALAAKLGTGATRTARDLLLTLSTARGTRRRRSSEELAREIPSAERGEILEAFVAARLVVREDGNFTLAHEALLSQWPRLATWVAESRRARELVEDVERGAARWDADPRRDLLLRGRSLADATELARERTLSELASRYVRASRRFELRSMIGILALAFSVVVAVIVVYAIDTSAERRVLDAQNEAARFVAPLLSERHIPDHERARATRELIEAKRQCERALEAERRACASSSGAR